MTFESSVIGIQFAGRKLSKDREAHRDKSMPTIGHIKLWSLLLIWRFYCTHTYVVQAVLLLYKENAKR